MIFKATIKKMVSIKKSVFIMTLVLVLSSCQSLKTAIFDQYSYQQAISIKVESLNLMSDADQSFSVYEVEVQDLLLELQKMIEYEKNKPDNEVSYAMWKVLANKEKNLLAGFFKRWKDGGKLSETFTNEAKLQVAEALDLIIKYEAQKNKTNETNILNFLGTN
ncbi:hypothetical protein [Psychroserpens ponticola]|uniref:Uncharacterized protein n=1 Tax=Psychroserpens ponticola TaxID=2932268 RepID=A0ABY7RU26_9FLAO|nr:hypothetical protein [Psychroserpens ponticola]WCO00424.1 hypothetical protein MUN68_010115 [Psychroserpens ponticola]